MSDKETVGNRTVLAFAAFLLVAGLVAGIIGLKAGGAQRPLAPTNSDTAQTISCVSTRQHPGPALDLGVQAARPHLTLSQATVVRLVRLAKRAGATVISTTANWRGIQPTSSPRYRWAAMDEVIDAARAAGLQVRLELQGMPGWAVDKKMGPAGDWRPPLTRAELTRWSSFVAALTRHVAGRVAYLSVWSEPNLQKTWSTGPSPAAYTRLLHATYPVVKRLAPRIQVISGGLSNNDLGFLQQVYAAKARLYGAQRSLFDLVGLHPFSGNRSPLVNQASYDYLRRPFGEVDQNFLGFRRIHALMAAHGDGGLDLYLGAFGYSTTLRGATPGVPDATRAVYAKQALSALACYPYVRALSWYYLEPTPWDQASWTLLNNRLEPNKTYQALAEWTRHSRRR